MFGFQKLGCSCQTTVFLPWFFRVYQQRLLNKEYWLPRYHRMSFMCIHRPKFILNSCHSQYFSIYWALTNYYSHLCYHFQFEKYPYHLRGNRNRIRVIPLMFLLAHSLCHLFTYIFYLGLTILPWKIWTCYSFISSCSLPVCSLCSYIVFFSNFSFFSFKIMGDWWYYKNFPPKKSF